MLYTLKICKFKKLNNNMYIKNVIGFFTNIELRI